MMMMRIDGLLFAVALAGCGSRLAGDVVDEKSGEGEGESGASSTSSSTGGETTGPADTSTTTASTESTTGGVKFDLAEIPDAWDPNLPDVCKQALEGTTVAGNPPLGAFAGTRAWFVGDADWVRLVIFDDSADVEAEAAYAGTYSGQLDKGPAIIVEQDLLPMLPKTEPLAVEHFVDGDSEWFMSEVTIDEIIIDDFNAPYILRGSFALWPDQNADGITGDFEAVYCENYRQMFWGE